MRSPPAVAGGLVLLQPEDRRTDHLDGVVQVAHDVGDTIPHRGLLGDLQDGLQRHTGGEQSLDRLVVQVPADPIAVGEHHQLFGVRAPRGELQSHGGLRCHIYDHPYSLGAERRSAGMPHHHEHAVDLARLGAHRRHIRGPRVRLGAHHMGARRPARAELADRALEHPPADRTVDRQHDGLQPFGTGPAGHPRGQGGSGPIRQEDHGRRGAGHGGDPLDEHSQHSGHVHAGQQPASQLGGGIRPLLPAPGIVIEPGVVDRHAGRGGQSRQQRLVVGVERRSAAFPGQVQVAVDLLAHPDRHLQEGARRRVAVREPDGDLMVGHVRQPQRLRMADQPAQKALAGRIRPDLGDLLRAEADGHESLQAVRVILAGHPERPVAGVDQLGRGLDDGGQHLVQVQSTADGQNALEKLLNPVTRGPDLRHTGHQPVEQFVKLKVGQGGMPRFAGCVLVHGRIRLPLRSAGHTVWSRMPVQPPPTYSEQSLSARFRSPVLDRTRRLRAAGGVFCQRSASSPTRGLVLISVVPQCLSAPALPDIGDETADQPPYRPRLNRLLAIDLDELVTQRPADTGSAGQPLLSLTPLGTSIAK